MFYYFLLAVHIIACLMMILVVLLQTGRGAGLQIFGGGGDSLINTPSGNSFMRNFTTGLAATFAFTSLFLTLLSSRAGITSVTSRVQPPEPTREAPPVPGETASPKTPAPIPMAPAKEQPKKK